MPFLLHNVEAILTLEQYNRFVSGHQLRPTLQSANRHSKHGTIVSLSCRAHGFRFDHLSFVANQRRSEKARNFLDLLRHSQLYEVFINERLALAAADYRTSDAFEAKVDFVLSKKGKVGRFVAQAGARGVSNISAVLQRTSTLVKVRNTLQPILQQTTIKAFRGCCQSSVHPDKRSTKAQMEIADLSGVPIWSAGMGAR